MRKAKWFVNSKNPAPISIFLFCAVLFVFVLFNLSLVVALLIGLLIFLIYGRTCAMSWKTLTGFCIKGVTSAWKILTTFVLIGMLTALWRASGTLAEIIVLSSDVIRPSCMILISFLLTCFVSFLTGTSFGTAATMGVICMSISNAMGFSPIWMGGAILAGSFFGDRCSPVSTSALLVATLTNTDLYANLKKLFQTSFLPFVLTCLIYGVAGFLAAEGAENLSAGDTVQVFRDCFELNLFCLLPAIVILILPMFRIGVRTVMSISILLAIGVVLFVQKTEITQILYFLIFGFQTENELLSELLGGGGILSMARAGAIVCIASCYSGIFQGTGMLDFLKTWLYHMAERRSCFFVILLVSVLVSMVSCNQTLAIMLADQLCRDLNLSDEDLAVSLENTTVVIAPLIPWSIASTVPLSAVGAPHTSILFACYLYFLPLCSLLHSITHRDVTSVSKGA